MSTNKDPLVQARELHRAGRLAEAEPLYRQALAQDPQSADVLQCLGAVLGAMGQTAEAAALLEEAVQRAPQLAEAHHHLGVVRSHQGRLDEAIESLKEAAGLRPQSAEITSNLQYALAIRESNRGVALAAEGKLTEAVACFRTALETRSDYSDAYFELGGVLLQQKLWPNATACFRRLLELEPARADGHFKLGYALEQQDELGLAVASYERSLQLQADDAAVVHRLGLVYLRQGKIGEAIARLRRAVDLMPENPAAINNLGVALMKENQPEEAEACYRRAIALKPDYDNAYHNLGLVLKDQRRLDEAADAFRTALEHKPDLIEALSDLGSLLARQGKVDEARQCFAKGLEFQPEQDIWKLEILSLCPAVFDSESQIDEYRAQLLAQLEAFAQVERRLDLARLMTSTCRPSFNLQFQGRNDRPIREAYAKIFAHNFPKIVAAGSSGRPRIGFVVTDGHERAFLKSMGGVVDRMQSDRFELVVICSNRGMGTLRAGLRNRDVRLLGTPTQIQAIAQAIRPAQFDLLYYWEVATDNSNYFLPFIRLAPVQCTSWGIQVTSGIGQLDYYLSSELVEPAEAAEHYSEKLVLSSTLLSYQQRLAIAGEPLPRKHFGIRADQNLYLCAQQLGKFQPDFDPILADILRRDAAGLIVITDDAQGGFVGGQLLARFAATITDVANRIVVLPRQTGDDYLSLIAAADVLLDPLHFGGVNSTYDGFSLNQPIVTLPSNFQRGRYTLGCYRKMGITDCIASSAEHYAEIAVALATDRAHRQSVVQKIEQASGALFDDVEAVREHERIFSMLIAEARAN